MGIWLLFWTLRELCPANILHTLFVENPIIKGVCWVCSRNPFNTAAYMPPRLRALCVCSLSDSLLGFISDCGQPQCVFFSFCPFSLFSMCCCGLLFSRGRRPLSSEGREMFALWIKTTDDGRAEGYGPAKWLQKAFSRALPWFSYFPMKQWKRWWLFFSSS